MTMPVQAIVLRIGVFIFGQQLKAVDPPAATNRPAWKEQAIVMPMSDLFYTRLSELFNQLPLASLIALQIRSVILRLRPGSASSAMSRPGIANSQSNQASSTGVFYGRLLPHR